MVCFRSYLPVSVVFFFAFASRRRFCKIFFFHSVSLPPDFSPIPFLQMFVDFFFLFPAAPNTMVYHFFLEDLTGRTTPARTLSWRIGPCDYGTRLFFLAFCIGRHFVCPPCPSQNSCLLWPERLSQLSVMLPPVPLFFLFTKMFRKVFLCPLGRRDKPDPLCFLESPTPPTSPYPPTLSIVPVWPTNPGGYGSALHVAWCEPSACP